MHSELKRAIRHTGVYSVGTVLQRLGAFVLIPLYVRRLSPSEYGTLALILMVVSVLGIFLNLGMSSALFKFFFETQDRLKRTAIVSTAFYFVFVCAVLVVGVAVYHAPAISKLLFRSYSCGSLLRVAFATALADTLTNIPLALLRAHGKSAHYTLSALSKFVVSISMILFFVLTKGEGVLGVLKGELIASVAICTVLLPGVLRKNVGFSFSRQTLRQLLAFGAPLVPSGLATWILTLSDRYFLQHFSTLEEVGLYSLGYRIGTLINVLVVAPFTLAWGPLMFSVQNESNAKAVYSTVLTHFVWVSAFVGLCFSLCARPLLQGIASPAYLRAYTVVFPITCSYILYGAYMIFTVGATLTKKTQFLPLVTGCAACLNLALNYLLIPRYGMMGAAFATILSYFSMAFLMFAASSKVYFVQYEFARLGKIVLVTSSIFAVSLLTHRLSLRLEISCKAALLVSYPFLLHLVNFFKDDEKKEIKNFVSSLPIRMNRQLTRRAQQ